MVGVAQSTGMVPPILAPFLALTGRVGLTGSSRPADGWQVPVTVKLFPSGANPLVDTALHTYLATTIQAGTVAAFTITGVPPGTYDISVDSEHTLMNLKRDAVVSGSVVVVDLGSLLEGDADDNEVVNVLDFTLLVDNFFKASPIIVP